MRSPSSSSRPSLFHAVIAGLIVLSAIALWKAGGTGSDRLSPQTAATAATQPTPSTQPLAAPQSGAAAQAKKAAAAQTFDWFQRRPFAVARSSGKHEWTEEDGRTPDAILDLAHNEIEVQRLMEENERIKRRQLVYRKEPVFVAVERARATGEPVRALTLPGLDGQELEVEVTRADVEPSGLKGTFAGRLKGRSQSLVTLAFKLGREAFTVSSPEDGVHLVGDPREPGEIIVKAIDPDTYVPWACGKPTTASR